MIPFLSETPYENYLHYRKRMLELGGRVEESAVAVRRDGFSCPLADSTRGTRLAMDWHERPYELRRGYLKPHFGFWMAKGPLAGDAAQQALAWARSLPGLWQRCQELTFVAYAIEDIELRRQVLAEAFADAYLIEDRNRVVTVAAWPLRALLDFGEIAWFERELERLLPIILRHHNPFSLQDGLHALFFSDAPEGSRNQVLDLYLDACQWAQKTLTMRRMAEYINEVDHPRALQVALAIRDPRRRRRALRAIGEARLIPE